MSDPNLPDSSPTSPTDTAQPDSVTSTGDTITTTATLPPGPVLDTAQIASELTKTIVKTLEPVAADCTAYVPTADPGPEVKFKLVYNKQNYEIVLGEHQTVRELKDHIEGLTKLPRSMQKLMFKGKAQLGVLQIIVMSGVTKIQIKQITQK